MGDIFEKALNGSVEGNTMADALFDTAKAIRILAENMKPVHDMSSSIENIASAVECVSMVKDNQQPRKLRDCVVELSAHQCLDSGLRIDKDYKEFDGVFHCWGRALTDSSETYSVGIVEITDGDLEGKIYLLYPESIKFFNFDEK
jgi:hypothetical protein